MCQCMGLVPSWWQRSSLTTPNLVIILNRIIICDGSICIFTSNIPCDSSILKEDLPDNLFGFSGISSTFIESEIIPFNLDGPYNDASKYKPNSRKLAK